MKLRIRLLRVTEIEVGKDYSLGDVLSSYETAESKRVRRAVTRVSTKQLVNTMNSSLEELGIQDGEMLQVALDFRNGYNKDAEYNQVC
jgi:uncharacterized ubiquitin-like protein YukD